ncbi:hypothetical protein PMAYCL1PPCAC_15929 [Pristionchus mayeri]|uniref:Ion channel n=1 Tax=Pristionchus mayeri TaxID=1317129 RepID=A0AAN5HYR4_9BILA|nr:hypothetical protein PMAYCL1PPCAC_15929 [Pristionchus mayeri]
MFTKLALLIGCAVSFPEAIDSTTCNVYSELESFAPCESSGYALNYGLPNCEAFTAKKWLYTTSGKIFLDCTRNCLADFIRTQIIAKGVSDCATIQSSAFDSHVPCYVDCGFCEVFPPNVIPFALTYRLSDFLSAQALKQVSQITSSCVSSPSSVIGPLVKIYGFTPLQIKPF